MFDHLKRWLGHARPATFATPPDTRLYAIGDIHGRHTLARRLRDLIDADRADNPVGTAIEITLGDYVDRGLNSADVIEDLLAPRASMDRRIFLRGNHEVYFAGFLAGELEILHQWIHNGALATLASYGVTVHPLEPDAAAAHEALTAAVPERHRAFLNDLENMAQVGDILFVHAGIRPGTPLAEQVPEDLLLIRDEFLDYEGPLPVRVVHGHTPVRTPTVTPYRINVDTGAFASRVLTCAVLEGTEVRFLQTEPADDDG